MIDIRELRIGNIVQPTNDIQIEAPRPIDIEWWSIIYEREKGLQTGEGMDWEIDVEPVPISAEWLERLGFDYDMITYSLGSVWIAYGDMKWDVFLHGLYNGITTSIKHLHQLQNLYHALTGQELTIKEIA